MRNLVFILFAIFFYIIQCTVLRYISIGYAIPDLVLIILCYIALFHGRVAIWYGFCLGLLVDLYTIKGFGFNTLVNTIIAWAIGYFSGYLYRGRLISHAIVLFFTAWIHDLIIAIPKGQFSFYTFYSKILPSSIYTTLVGIILFFLFQKIDERI